MRPSFAKVTAAILLVAVAAASVQVAAMRGSGSPDWDVGNPRSLTEFTGCTPDLPCSPAPAVYYPAAAAPRHVPACASSPVCIPSPPLQQASPWFSTPPPSGQGGSEKYRIENPCMAAPETPLFVGSPNQYTNPEIYPDVVRYAEWSPIESLTNLRALPAVAHVAPGSIANTPFNAPPATPLHNQHAVPPGAVGDGRFHVDNQSLVQSVFDASQQANFLFFADGDPNDAEGAPDDRYVLLGHDGYILGRFEYPVVDGDGYDFQVNVVMPPQTAYGTFCVLGATNPTGPFSLVHSAYKYSSSCDGTLQTSSYCPELPPGSPPCPPGEACFSFDLRYYYTPLRTLRGESEPGRLDYFLVASSLTHTPYLRNDFEVVPSAVGQPLLRGQPVDFQETSERFGYPLWYQMRSEFPYDSPLGGRYMPDPSDMRPDPIAMWRWDFSSDPYALPLGAPPRPPATPPLPILPAANANRSPPYWTVNVANHDATHAFISPGIFPVCLSVHTYDQAFGDYLTVERQSDPPASDPWPPFATGLPTLKPITVSRTPTPDKMHCQSVTVYNIPPGIIVHINGDLHNPFKITFYDWSEDPDWIMPPGHPYGPRGNYDGCCACPDCPPDGIQLRKWDFQSDGIIDHTWQFTSRYVQDGRFCTANISAGGCPRDPVTGFPLAWEPADPTLLASPTIAFQPGDCHQGLGDEGATVYGPGIPVGAKILKVLSPTVARITLNVYADIPIPVPPSPFVLTCVYDVALDAPQFVYPRPGQYNATLTLCDYDWTVRSTDPIYGSRAWPEPFALQSAFHGDPEGPFTALDGTPLPDSPRPMEGHSLHACQSGREPVRIPNSPPQLSVPPTVVVRPMQQVVFRVLATDTDPGQELTLRPCPGVPMLPGMEFAPITLPGNSVSPTVSFNIGALGLGQYGPFCFEVTDGIAVTHAIMHIWVSGVSQDTDGDGTADLADNCPSIPNHDQADLDGDGVGDACQDMQWGFVVQWEPAGTTPSIDHDGDGIVDASDVCPSMADRDQADADADGVGDICDADRDGDGVANLGDNCPMLPNHAQADVDRDGRGDACAHLLLAKTPELGGRPLAEPQVAEGRVGQVALGLSLGVLSLTLVLVPLLYFALRRRPDDSKRP